MRRTSTTYLMKREEIEGIVNHLRNNDFDVKKCAENNSGYYINRKHNLGRINILEQSGRIEGSSLIILFGKGGDNLLGVIEKYVSNLPLDPSERPKYTLVSKVKPKF